MGLVGLSGAAARTGRVLEVIAGLLSAGLVALGVLLLLAKGLAPTILGGIGLARARGPEWWRLLTTLGIGVVGELARHHRGRLPGVWRIVASAAVIVLATATLTFVWWSSY